MAVQWHKQLNRLSALSALASLLWSGSHWLDLSSHLASLFSFLLTFPVQVSYASLHRLTVVWLLPSLSTFPLPITLSSLPPSLLSDPLSLLLYLFFFSPPVLPPPPHLPVHALLIFLFSYSVWSVHFLRHTHTHTQYRRACALTGRCTWKSNGRGIPMTWQTSQRTQHNTHKLTHPLRRALRNWLKRQVECTLYGSMLLFTHTHTCRHIHTPM